MQKHSGKALTLSLEDVESLKALHTSPHYAVYKRILINAKEAYFNSTMPMTDPNEILKQIGIVTGINYCLNQLPAMIMMYEQKIKALENAKLQKEN